MIGIFGGTFDPIHHGHLRCALEIAEQLELREVRMLPCGQPPHRDQPQAAGMHRRRMAELALQGQSLLTLDTRELDRAGPSYMVDTLTDLRREVDGASLCMILGQDAFNGLDRWHQWERLIDLTHLVVITRPGVAQPENGPIAALADAHSVETLDELRARPAGHILFRTVTPLGFSASGIRAQLAAGLSPRYLLPEAVLAYIEREALYRDGKPIF